MGDACDSRTGIVDRIVSAHGGRVEVSSGEESGTTFVVYLPRA